MAIQVYHPLLYWNLYSSGIGKETLELKETKKDEERRKVTLQTLIAEVKPVIDIQRYQSFTQMMRITAWVLYFVFSLDLIYWTTCHCQWINCLKRRPRSSNKHKHRCFQTHLKRSEKAESRYPYWMKFTHLCRWLSTLTTGFKCTVDLSKTCPTF